MINARHRLNRDGANHGLRCGETKRTVEPDRNKPEAAVLQLRFQGVQEPFRVGFHLFGRYPIQPRRDSTHANDGSPSLQSRYDLHRHYEPTLQDGQDLAGVISDESGAGITLTMPGNISQRIARQDVRAITALGASLMPDGLAAGVSPQDMADLITHLTSNRN